MEQNDEMGNEIFHPLGEIFHGVWISHHDVKTLLLWQEGGGF